MINLALETSKTRPGIVCYVTMSGTILNITYKFYNVTINDADSLYYGCNLISACLWNEKDGFRREP